MRIPYRNGRASFLLAGIFRGIELDGHPFLMDQEYTVDSRRDNQRELQQSLLPFIQLKLDGIRDLPVSGLAEDLPPMKSLITVFISHSPMSNQEDP